MYVRALIVVLAILNAGVALWWATRPAASPPPPPQAPAGVAALQLMLTPAPASPPAPAAPAAAEAPVATPPSANEATKPVATLAADRCVSFGPFADQATAEAARRAAGDALRNPRLREAAEASSYRVMLTGVGDSAAAQAVVARIKAAGVSDYYLVGNTEAHDIALGQYRNREGAERRQAELAAKGFQAEVLPGASAGGASRWWMDARTRADNAALRGLKLPAPRSLDCATLR